MDFPEAEPLKDAAQWRRAAWVAAILALAAYAEILGLHMGAVAGGSDSSGYLNHAKLLSAGAFRVQQRTIQGLPASQAAPYLYVPLGFRPAWDGAGMVPTYPLGLSLFIVVSKALVGWRHAGDVTLMLHAIAGILATYGLGRMAGQSRPWAALCSAAVALSPLYLFMSLQAMSDVPSLFWTTLAVVASLKAGERPAWAAAGGAALAVDVLLRPANVLAFFPAAVALGFSPRRWAYLAAGGLPGAALFFLHNASAYGGYATTGYGDSLDAFSLALVPGTLSQYLRWLPVLFTPAVLLFPGLPFLSSVPLRIRLTLLLWVGAFAAFYSVYWNTHETWWYLRFLLPMAPALVVGSGLVLRSLLVRFKGGAALVHSPVLLVAALGLVSASSLWWCKDLGALHVGEEELRYGLLTDWMRANMPADAVCLTMQASGSIYFYTPFTVVRWDQLAGADIPKIRSALAGAKRPLYAVLFPFELERIAELQHHYGGTWSPVGKVEDVLILRHVPGAPFP